MAVDATQAAGQPVTLRIKDIALALDTATDALTELTVDYDVVVGGVPTAKTWSGAPGPGLAADLWTVLAKYLAGVLAAEGVTMPATPTPAAPARPAP